ncbi:2,4'-dihydroxyacetophenone dioxygenase family protein [Parapedomonas caeni]|jgi:anti-sigma factor ChrR (cupin superfamily)
MSAIVQHTSMTITQPHKPAFFDTSTLPWKPWVMEGTHYKLLSINPRTGGFTMLLKVDAGNEAPVHGHLGTVEAYIVEGGFGYGADRGRVGAYVLEEGGINHQPDTDNDGVVMFAVAHGPLCGFNEDGSIAAVVDGKLMYQRAREHGVAGHIAKPEQWTDIA